MTSRRERVTWQRRKEDQGSKRELEGEEHKIGRRFMRNSRFFVFKVKISS